MSPTSEQQAPTLCAQDPRRGLLTDVASLRIQAELDLSLDLFLPVALGMWL